MQHSVVLGRCVIRHDDQSLASCNKCKHTLEFVDRLELASVASSGKELLIWNPHIIAHCNLCETFCSIQNGRPQKVLLE